MSVTIRPYRRHREVSPGRWSVDIRIRLPKAGGGIYRLRILSPVTGKTAARSWGEQRQQEVLRLNEEGLDLAGIHRRLRGEESKASPTVAALVDRWIADRKARGVGSVKDEEARLRLYVVPVLGTMLANEVRPHHVRDLLRDLRAKPSPKGGTLAPRTIRHIYTTLRQAFTEAVVDEVLPANPVIVKRADLPAKADKDPVWRAQADFTRQELEALISDTRIPDDRRIAYAMEFLTGMRTGEASARRWRDYDSTVEPLGRIVAATSYNSRRRTEAATKTGTVHWVPVHPVLASVLASWKLSGWRKMHGRAPGPDDLIIPGREGGPRCAGWALKCFYADLKTLGLRRRRHYDTRATFLSLAEADGARSEALRWITHPSPRDAMDGYKRLSLLWPALCEAVSCLKVELREGRVIHLDRGGGVEAEVGEVGNLRENA